MNMGMGMDMDMDMEMNYDITTLSGTIAPKVKTDPYYIPGILLGFAMLFFIQIGIVSFTFREQLKYPNIPIQPEKYFHACIYSLLGMVATGEVITYIWSESKYSNYSFQMNYKSN